MLLYLKRPAPDQEPRLTAMIDGIRAAGAVSHRNFATPRELERLLADDLAVLLSESFAGATAGTGAPRMSPTGPGEPGPVELPAGTVTLSRTDIEGSTRLWETVPDAMEVALERHDRLLTEVIERHGGVVVRSRGEGDSFFAVFPSAVAAVEAAVQARQLRLAQEAWPAGIALRVRMGLHTGEARARGGSDRIDHAPVNRRARRPARRHRGGLPLAAHLHRQRRLLDQRAAAAPGRARDPVHRGPHPARGLQAEDRHAAADRLRRVERLVPQHDRRARGAVHVRRRAGRGDLPEHLRQELRLGPDGEPGANGERHRAHRHQRRGRGRAAHLVPGAATHPGGPGPGRGRARERPGGQPGAARRGEPVSGSGWRWGGRSFVRPTCS